MAFIGTDFNWYYIYMDKSLHLTEINENFLNMIKYSQAVGFVIRFVVFLMLIQRDLFYGVTKKKLAAAEVFK